MAVRASELLLIIRAQNQASSALRRLGSDLQTLGKGSTLKRAQAQANVAEQNLMRQRMRAMRELDSITSSTGQRNLLQQQRLAGIQTSRNKLLADDLRLQERGARLADARAAAENRIRVIETNQIANLRMQQAQMEKLAASEVAFMDAQKRAASTTWASGVNKGRISTPVPAEQLAYAEAAYTRQKSKLAELVKQQEAYGSSLAITQKRLSGFALREDILTKDTEALTKANTDLALAEEKVAAAMRQEQARAAELSAELSVISQRLAIVRNEQRALSEQVRAARWTPLITLGSIMEHIARVTMQSGLVIGATFAYMAHSAAQFSTQAGLAATQVANKFGKGIQGTLTAQKQIADGIVKIMKSGQATANSTDQNAAAYDIFSSMTLHGNQKRQIEEGMAILKQFNKAAIAGQVDLQSITHAGITILNDFGKTGQQSKELPGFLNRMFASVRFGRTTVGEFVSSLNQVAPAFSAAFGNKPASFDSLAQMMGVLTRFMPSSRMAATALARLAQQFNNPDFVAGMKKSGAPITDTTGHLVAMDKILGIIVKKFPDLVKGGPALGNFFKTITALGSGKAGNKGTTQAARAFSELVQHMDAVHKISGQVIRDNNELFKSFRTEQATPGVKWQEFTTALKAMVIEIGSYAIPAFIKLGEPLVKAVKWFDKLSDSTKKQIATWGTYGAAILLAASAVLFVVGAILKLTGTFGRLGILGPVIIGMFVAFKLAVAALHGNLNSLNDVITTMFNALAPHGAWGWIAYLSIAAVAALKLSRALTAVRDAYVATTAAAAIEGAAQGGGLAGGLGNLAGGVANFARNVKALRAAKLAAGAGNLEAGFAGIAGAVGGLSVSIPVIAGGIALAAAGAYAWEQHMQRVKDHAAEIAAIEARNKAFYAKPFGDIASFGTFGKNIGNTIQAQKQLNDYVKAYKEAQAVFKKSPTSVNRIAMLSAGIDVARATDVVLAANKRANASFDKASQAIYQYGHSVQDLAGKKILLAAQQRELDKLQNAPGTGIAGDDKRHQQIADLISHIKELNKWIHEAEATTQQFGAAFHAAFAKNINQLASFNLIPKMAPQFIPMLEQVAEKAKRMLNRNEITLLVNAMVDPKVANDLPKGLRNIFNQVEHQLMAQAGKQSVLTIHPKIKTVFSVSDATKAFDGKNPFEPGGKFSPLGIMGKDLHKMTVDIKTHLTQPNAKPILNKINTFFSKNTPHTTMKVKAPDTGDLVKIGNQISAGIHSGLKVIDQEVDIYVKEMVKRFQVTAQIHSPSRLFAKEVGQPIGQGIAKGILSTTDLIKSAITKQITDVIGFIRSQNLPNKTQALTMNLFGGEFLTKRVSAIEGFDPATAKQKLAEADAIATQIKKLEAKLGSGSSTSKFTVGRPVGLVQRGNIDLNARPIVKNKDGSVSTVKSVSFGTKAGEVLIPEVVGNKVVSAIEAWKHYLKTGQNLGTFKSVAAANAYAEALHREQEAYAKNTTAAKANARARIEVDRLREAADRRAAIKPPKLTITDLIKDTERTAKAYRGFNKDINALAKAGIPPKMLDDLRALGIDGKKYLDLMAEAIKKNPKALKELIAAWKEEQKQVQKSTYISVEDIKNMTDATKAQLKSMAGDAAQSMLSTWNNFHDQMQSAFGNLFEGPSGLAGMIGDNLKSAQDQYKSDSQSLRDQITADNKQLADLMTQAVAQMQQSFGSLFSGDWMQSTQVQTRLQFGQKLGFDDIFKDLQGQTTRFEHWQDDLKSLAKKVPAGLLQALKDLGPDAINQLDALNGATSDELAKYIKLWKKGQGDIGKAAKDLLSSGDFKSQTAAILSDLKSVTTQLSKLVVPHALTPQDLITDLKSQSDAFTNYQDTIAQLQAKGLPDQLIAQLQALGPQGLDYLKALNNMTSDQLSKYVDIWTTAQGKITDATNTMFQTQLDMWTKYGANIGAAIIAGVATDQQALIDYFTHLFLDLLNGRTPAPPPGANQAPSGGTGNQGQAYYGDQNKRGKSSSNKDTQAPPPPKTGTMASTGNSTTINQEIHAYQAEDLLSTLAKSNFRLTTVLPKS